VKAQDDWWAASHSADHLGRAAMHNKNASASWTANFTKRLTVCMTASTYVYSPRK